jgi:Phage integrase central domain
VEVAKARETAERERALRVHHAFSSVAETFIADKLAQERDGKNAERIMRSTFIAAWGDRPISEITSHDVRAIIDAKRRRAPQMSRALMTLIRRFFYWALDHDNYGLDRLPCDRLSMSRMLGAVPKRNRRLTQL